MRGGGSWPIMDEGPLPRTRGDGLPEPPAEELSPHSLGPRGSGEAAGQGVRRGPAGDLSGQRGGYGLKPMRGTSWGGRRRFSNFSPPPKSSHQSQRKPEGYRELVRGDGGAPLRGWARDRVRGFVRRQPERRERRAGAGRGARPPEKRLRYCPIVSIGLRG